MSAPQSWPAPPAPEGQRLLWTDLPARTRARIEAHLEEAVVEATSQPGGFSPGLAARLVTASGRRVFVKAVGPEPNAESPRLHRREARIAAQLRSVRVVPRLLWSDEEDQTGWVVLAFEDVEGAHPRLPWRADELERVLAAVDNLAHELTPSPVARTEAGTLGTSRVVTEPWWANLAADPPPGLDTWSARHSPRLAEIQPTAPAVAASGDTLLHMDLRVDNILVAPHGIFFVDWPHARIGAAWVDLVFMAPSVTMQGGLAPETLLAGRLSAQGVNADNLTSVVVAVAGFFTYLALQPPPPGLPTLRAFQAAQARVARDWVAQRTGLH